MHSLKEIIDILNTDGGHISIALILLFVGLFCEGHWQMPAGKELFIFALGVLGMALKSTGKANGQTVSVISKVESTEVK